MYNTTAFLYDTVCAFEEPEKTCEEIHNIFLRRGIQPPGVMADLGAGTGLMSILFAERGWQMYGIELSPAMVAVAREKTARLTTPVQERLSWNEGDISSFALPAGFQFDGAICLCNTINHLAEWEQLVGFMQSSFQALKPGGVMILDSDTFSTFQGFFNHERTVVWDDAIHRMTRACQFDYVSGRAHHVATIEKYEGQNLIQVSEESMQLQYHLETDLFGAFQATGFQVEGARPYNPCPQLYQGFFPKLLWVLRKPA